VVGAHGSVRNRDRRIVRFIRRHGGSASPGEISRALDIPPSSLRRRLHKLTAKRMVLYDPPHRQIQLTSRGVELARGGYVPRSRVVHRPGRKPGRTGRRVKLADQRLVDTLVRAITDTSSTPDQPPIINRKLPVTPPPAPPVRPTRAPSRPDPSELGGVYLGSGTWLVNGDYVRID